MFYIKHESVNAKLTDGQIKTLELSYSTYQFATSLANGVKSFGMWMLTPEPDGFGIITGTRFKSQEDAGEDAPDAMNNMDLLMNWVEKNEAPAKTLVIDERDHIKIQKEGKGYLLCSYPNYQKCVSSPADEVSSYVSAAP